MGIRGSNKIVGIGRPKKPPAADSFPWRPGEMAYRTPRRAPKMRPGTPEERSTFAAEIRAKTKLFEGGK